MRTTVTLDPDVEQLLRVMMKARRLSFKEALNKAIRGGAMKERQGQSARFVQQTFSMGAEQHFRWEKALAASDAMEDDELIRRRSETSPAGESLSA
jgi:xanthine dehydrogenase molybdopterin-binding subunit B